MSVKRGSFFLNYAFLHFGVNFLMIIVIISHLRVPGSSSSGKRNKQFEAILTLKDLVKLADLQWCNVLSTNLIRSDIFCCWKSISKDSLV